jgi:hypothetical protein
LSAETAAVRHVEMGCRGNDRWSCWPLLASGPRQ